MGIDSYVPGHNFHQVELKEKVENTILFAQYILYFKPFTIRLLYSKPQSNNTKYTISESEVALFAIGDKHYPIILGDNDPENFLMKLLEPNNRRKNAVLHKFLNLYSLFTIIEVNVGKLSNDRIHKINSGIQKTVNPKLDFVMIILYFHEKTVTEQNLETFLSQKFPILPRLRNKLLCIFTEQCTIWFDPKVYSKGHLVKLSDIPNQPLAHPRMGYNLRGRHLYAAISEAPPFCYEIPRKSDKSPRIFKGLYTSLFYEASKTFNYTFTITHDGFGYGNLLPNGTWTGKYARIYYPDSGYDLILQIPNHILMWRGDRSSAVNVVNIGFVVNIPKKGKVPWYAFMQPYEPSLWIILICTFCIFGAIQVTIVYFLHLQNKQIKLTFESIWDSAVFYQLSIFLEQGLNSVPQGLRACTVILLLSSLVLGTGYKSTLRSHLMFPKPEKVPGTFQELANMEDYKVTLLVLGKIETSFFLESDVKLLMSLKKRIKLEKNWMKCLNNAFFEEKHACVNWNIGKAIIAQKMTLNTTVLPFVYSKDTLLEMFSGIGFQEHSIFVTGFELIVSSCFEMGLVKKWEEESMFELGTMGRRRLIREFEEGNQTSAQMIVPKLLELTVREDERRPLKLESLIAVFAFVLVGVALGLFVVGLENAWWVGTKIMTRKKSKDVFHGRPAEV